MVSDGAILIDPNGKEKREKGAAIRDEFLVIFEEVMRENPTGCKPHDLKLHFAKLVVFGDKDKERLRKLTIFEAAILEYIAGGTHDQIFAHLANLLSASQDKILELIDKLTKEDEEE